MPDHVASSSHDEDVTSMTSSKSHQPIWMSHCNNRSSKPGSTVENSGLVCYDEGHVDMRGCLIQNGFKTEDGVQYGKGASKGAGEIQTRILNQNLTKKLGNFDNSLSNSSFPTLSLGRNKGKSSAVGTQIDHEFGHRSTALALAVGQESTSREINLRNREQQAMSHLYQEQKGIAGSRACTYDKSNDNFTCFSQERRKYQKSSSVLFHEKKMENNICHEPGHSDGLHLHHGYSPGQKSFQSFFLKKQPQSVRGQPLNRVPCSFHNVETMRICTMIDSMENSPGDPPRVSQRAHHILFTKETCVNLSEEHQLIREPSLGHQEGKTFGGSFSNLGSHARGVKIQPLWTSTDSEREPSGSPSTCKAGSWNEASAETDGVQAESTLGHQGEKRPFGGLFSMYPNNSSHSRGVKIQPLWTSTDSEEKENRGDASFGRAGSKNKASAKTDGMPVEAPKKKRILMGMESSPLNQDDTVDENSPKAACDSSTEKARSKRPMTEIPDINEDPPEIQPEVSSTDGKEPSSSRVHSLNAKQLFSCHGETSRSVCNGRQESSLGPDTSNRWIKRLKNNEIQSG
ncbi:uncharacterized protein LOC104904330 isoform X2 [Beta vulgaris subsp. vulgaris]|uniref:uncharacterized protein LOC104904330 isoform X2 n=1 Tax=Beta vulgaris subsp. vulgaris TaxID=3555 RepID=UPI00053F98FE|nr:uncharacterized protein LOC104904330 isoform X2 [Beta vulgaris subsp. vulgaris]